MSAPIEHDFLHRPDFGMVRVQLKDGNQEEGIVRYFGNVEIAPGTWVGVELNKPVGRNNGTVKGVTYFSCPDEHGVFVLENAVTKLERSQ